MSKIKKIKINGVPYEIDGMSAYEVAVENGFEGTEEEWLASLKGADGEQGIQGERGIQGEQGIQGIQGEKGADGKDGADGVSPELVQTTGDGEDVAMSQKAVTDALAGKVNIKKNTNTQPYAYTADPNSTDITLIGLAVNPKQYQIARYNGLGEGGTNAGNGCITTSDPSKPYHCANKKYVDESLAPIIEKVKSIASLELGVTNALGERVETVEEIVDHYEDTYPLPENTLPFVKIENAFYEEYYGIYTNEETGEMETGAVTATITGILVNGQEVTIPEDGIVELGEGETAIIFVTPDYELPDGGFMMARWYRCTLTYQVKVGA